MHKIDKGSTPREEMFELGDEDLACVSGGCLLDGEPWPADPDPRGGPSGGCSG